MGCAWNLTLPEAIITQMLMELLITTAKKNKLIKSRIVSSDKARIQAILTKIRPLISNRGKVLDIGSGTGHIAEMLINEGYRVTTCDIKDTSLFEEIHPIIIKDKLPFEDKSFTTSMLITVLHHTKNPEEISKEAKRVSDKIIVMEDTYKTPLQKLLTFFMDSFYNLEFIGHPHTNKTEEEWEKVFKDLELIVLDKNSHPFWKFFTSTTYLLEAEY